LVTYAYFSTLEHQLWEYLKKRNKGRIEERFCEKKQFFFILVLFFVSLVLIAQEAPMRGWSFNSGSVTLNDRHFKEDQYAESWREQDGYALVQGVRRHYWLYDSYSYHNGKADELIDIVIPKWVEKMGYVIDFDNIRYIYPNPDLAYSVKALMAQRGCDISVTLITDIPPYHFVIINNYDEELDLYSSVLYPLYK